MRLLVATDAWAPQINGVVRTYECVAREAAAFGVQVVFLTPGDFRCLPNPVYPDVRLAVWNPARARQLIEAVAANYVHIATEGPVGLMARAYCVKRAVPFTTSYHTRFPEYGESLLRFPPRLTYAAMRWFHGASVGTMVATPSLRAELSARGFKRLLAWTRGVDSSVFRPRPDRLLGPGPVFLSVGRISKEKNLESFLDLDLPGRKVVVGDGPHRPALQRRYPGVHFVGMQHGEELVRHYASADVLVFPSRTETFGLVMLEAMACGVPVAAYPATGPRDVIDNGVTGVLHEDLAIAARQALTLDRSAVRARALSFSWAQVARLFVSNVTSACDSARAAQVRARISGAAHARRREMVSEMLHSREKPFG